jgi:hypothetical protein
LESGADWLQKLKDFTSTLTLVGQRDKEDCPEIKIAILDTGVTKECYDNLRAYIEDYKGFASGEDEIQQDGTGRGSTALRLLLKLNGSVKVFVGMVFKSVNADDDTEGVMAKVGF